MSDAWTLLSSWCWWYRLVSSRLRLRLRLTTDAYPPFFRRPCLSFLPFISWRFCLALDLATSLNQSCRHRTGSIHSQPAS